MWRTKEPVKGQSRGSLHTSLVPKALLSATHFSSIILKEYSEILWTEVHFSQRILIFLHIQKELSNTYLMQKPSSFVIIGRSLYPGHQKLVNSIAWSSIIHVGAYLASVKP